MNNGMHIVARGLSKSFRKADQVISVLQGIDLEINASASLSILGQSGAGKSTLLNILATLEAPDAGELLIDAKTMLNQDEQSLAHFRNQQLGFVFQFHHLLKDFSAEENVAMPLWISGMEKHEALLRAAKILKRVGLAHRLNHRGHELSGGEQQRVAIARALVHEPRLLLTDEPTGNLDPATAEQVQQLLLELNREKKCTWILVTHNENFAKMTDQRMWLDHGKMVHSMPNH